VSSPIERAARAVRCARALPGTNPVAKLSEVDYRVARAVIEAIREPSEGMNRAGWTADLPFTPSIKVDVVWQAMIDALLKEGK